MDGVTRTLALPCVKETASGNLLYGSGNSNRGSVSTLRGGMGERWERDSKGRGYMYAYG